MRILEHKGYPNIVKVENSKELFFSVGFHAQGGEQIHTEKQQVSGISKVSQERRSEYRLPRMLLNARHVFMYASILWFLPLVRLS